MRRRGGSTSERAKERTVTQSTTVDAAQRAELAAAAWSVQRAVAARDEQIRLAVAAGMSICEVELTTGVARWEVRRIAG